jgi:phosphate transport system substrate-binding protein
MKTKFILAAFIAAFTQAALADVALSGSGSVGRPITAKQAAIESQSSQKLVVTVKNSVMGLKDVGAGTAQIAMISGPLEEVSKALEPADAAKLKGTQVSSEAAAFIVNPANTVTSLTPDQIKDIFSGKVTNWKDVGGADMPIKVFILDKNNGPRLAADVTLFAGTTLVAGAVERSKSADITPIVSQVPGAISYVGIFDAKKASVKIVDDKALTIPLVLVTSGEPTAEEKAVIDAAKTALAQ